MNVSDDLADRIYRGEDQDLDIFIAAIGESIDFLASEVFPTYVALYPSLNAEEQSEQVSSWMVIWICEYADAVCTMR